MILSNAQNLLYNPVMNLLFRPAHPTDGRVAIPLIYSSGAAAFDFVFAHLTKGTAQDFLLYAFRDGAGEFGCRNHTVVEKDGQVVGIGATFSGKETMAFTLAAARQIFSFYGSLHAWKVIVKGLQIEKVVEPPKGNMHYIAHLGISPECRGLGMGTKLIHHFLEQGKALQRTTAALDVAVTNPRAEVLYERLGFVVIHERPSKLSNAFGTVVNHKRMEKSI
jgi:ribosomal protein S18 acetylase RimI-like enzyme